MNIKRIIKLITPPILLSATKELFSKGKNFPREYEYIPQGWSVIDSDTNIKGWNVNSILDVYKNNWPNFINNIKKPLPLSFSPEATQPRVFDLVYHNTLMIFAYCLAMAAHKKDYLKMLDWGGGIGHYYKLAKVLVPELEIDYHCHDVPVLAEYGQKLLPEGHFTSDECYLNERFDFILASSSIHYVEDWQSILAGFSNCVNGHILITRLPVTLAEASYVFVQRPYQYGYQTEYLGWTISRKAFLKYADQLGLKLLREFITGEAPNIYQAPSPCEYRAYLFARNEGKSNG